jgi:hypothetical protein
MGYHYINPARAADPHALPNVEVWYAYENELPDFEGDPDVGEYLPAGWYYAYGFPGCLRDSDPCGPFETEEQALEDARDGFEDGDEVSARTKGGPAE